MRSGSLCALLWRLLSWCHPRGIVLRARHIPGRLNVIADKLSRLKQVIQMECLLSQQVFNHTTTTRFNHKLSKFVSLMPDQVAWAVNALSLPWESLDVYAFPPVSLLNQAVSKVMDQGCRRMILIAPGWPNMPGQSAQIPFRLPLQKDLVTQTFNGLPHRNLKNLNLHAWLLEPPSFKNGFSDEVAARIKAPQRPSTRAQYKSKLAVFKWCESNEVDFQLPSVNQIGDFLLHLFKDKDLQPSTIEGYRTAIAEMVGNDKLNISKDENLTRWLDSFHRDRADEEFPLGTSHWFFTS